MQIYADLEIGLDRHDGQFYRLEPRLLIPDDQGERSSPGTNLLLTSFDRQKLDEFKDQNDMASYGALLGKSLLLPEVTALLTEGRSGLKQTPPVPLRIRLHIGASAPELHQLRWETLRDPLDNTLVISTDTREPFSRYLLSMDWRPVILRPKGSLRALVVVANPAPRPGDNLAPVQVKAEIERARAALKGIEIKTLHSAVNEIPNDPTRLGPPTLDEMIKALAMNFDILYLVCHGKLINGIAKIWLEDDQGQVDVVSAEEETLPNGVRRPGFVQQVSRLPVLPRLLVLASCESAGTGTTSDNGVLAAMGPRMVEAGVPAVIAMQGSITMTSVETFMPRFFELLCQEGTVDLAASTARQKLLDNGRPDWWMPVLFMRLRNGRIWYEPGFTEGSSEFETWPDLVQALRDKRCTPIIGPGLLEFLIGSTSELAREWADTLNFPMAPYSRTDLPRVARYLATVQTRSFTTSRFRDYLLNELWERHSDKLNGFQRTSELADIIRQVGVCCRQVNETDPFKVLAQLPVEIYITTTADDLLFDALKETGKKDPQVALCPWNPSIEQPDSAFTADPAYRPSVDKPLVYHLFGRLDQPGSLVISEDDYLTYLSWAITDQVLKEPATPLPVSRALARNALLFLGFQIDDWDFRVLFHSFTNPNAGIFDRHKSVAVQVSPDESSLLQPRRARLYLEKYYSKYRVETNVFWGTGLDFIQQIWERRNEWQK